MSDYRAAAAAAAASNPDGWGIDPEAIMAFDEWMFSEAQGSEARVEWLRGQWRSQAARWRATGNADYACWMVAIEDMAAEEAAEKAA